MILVITMSQNVTLLPAPACVGFNPQGCATKVKKMLQGPVMGRHFFPLHHKIIRAYSLSGSRDVVKIRPDGYPGGCLTLCMILDSFAGDIATRFCGFLSSSFNIEICMQHSYKLEYHTAQYYSSRWKYTALWGLFRCVSQSTDVWYFHGTQDIISIRLSAREKVIP